MPKRLRKESQLPVVAPTTWRPVVITTYPDAPAPPLRCPQCDEFLAYSATAFSSRQPLERWDRLECHEHGAFVYRHGTQTLRADRQARM